MTIIKCRFCGTIAEIPEEGRKLKKLRKGPPMPCKGDNSKLAPSHMEAVYSWDDHFQVLEHN
jgi:hypothetical protein